VNARRKPRDPVTELAEAVRTVERDFPLPRCGHGNAFQDHSGEKLDPSCGCRADPPRVPIDDFGADHFSTSGYIHDDWGCLAARRSPGSSGRTRGAAATGERVLHRGGGDAVSRASLARANLAYDLVTSVRKLYVRGVLSLSARDKAIARIQRMFGATTKPARAKRRTRATKATVPAPPPLVCGIGAGGGMIGFAVCDKAWGHKGDIHANAGDGFHAPEHLAEHRRRQNVLAVLAARLKADAILTARRR
jgi:hypothetical protein